MCSMHNSPTQADFEKFLPMYSALDSEAIMSSPKKEGIGHSVLNALNTMWEHISNFRSSFTVGTTCPLSVKIVNDGSNIQEQILKDLINTKEGVKNMYTQNKPFEITKSICSDMFDGREKPYTNKIFNENTKNYLQSRYECVDSKKEHSERSDKKESIEENIEHNTMDCNFSEPSQYSSEDESFEYIYTHSVNTKEMYSKDTLSNELPNNINSCMDDKTIKIRSPGALVTDAMAKQVCSPKHRTELNSVTHREEHMKQDLASNTENDLRDLYNTTDGKELEDCLTDDDSVSSIEVIMKEATNPVACTLADVEPKVETPKPRENIEEIPKLERMRSVPEYTEESYDEVDRSCTFNFPKDSLRPRKFSENSLDSEDSYCIIFEADAACESESEESEESDETSEDEDTFADEESVSEVRKVKFKLPPEVHIMVKWDFAYRAARIGQWQRMGRDNERFQRRIKSMEHVLNPILNLEHRKYVWLERFAVTE